MENPEEYPIDDKIGDEILREIKDVQLKYLQNNKTAINGTLLATYVNEVPNCFKSVIEKAIKE